MKLLKLLIVPWLFTALFSTQVQAEQNELQPPEISVLHIAQRSASVNANDINSQQLTVFLAIDEGEGSAEKAISHRAEGVFYTYSGLIPHRDYRFIAKACDNNNRCSEKSIKPFTTLPQTPTKPVTNVRLNNSANSISVLFNAPDEANHKDGITGYQLQIFPYQALSSCFTNNHPIVSSQQAQYQFTGLSPERDYSLCIRSVNALGAGSNSTGYISRRVTTAADIPAAAPVIAEIVSDQQLTIIRWQALDHSQANGKVIQNDVRYRLVGSSDWQERQYPGNGIMAFLLLNQALPGKLYEYSVRSHTAAGAGPWSDISR